MKLVSICPSNTELLAYLGLVDQLVAVDDFSDWPSKINIFPNLGQTCRLTWINWNCMSLT